MAFYVVDGTDGSGKSTVAGMLRDILESSGRSVCLVKHPNDGWLPGRAVLALLLREASLSRLLIALLFFADLIHSVFRMKCASDYDDFIFIRYTMSVCHLPDLFCRLLRRCLLIFFMKLDLAIFVDIPADVAMGRIEGRGGDREIFENRHDLESSRVRMRAMAGEEGWAMLDNSRGIDDVRTSLCSFLSIRAFNKNQSHSRTVMIMADLLADSGKALLLGNEAITRGLIESGVRFASTYPGTPSSEVGNILEKISDKAGLYFEFSINEKVAMEVAAAAAVSGVRSFVFMKHVGLNAAADPMMTLLYSGVRGGMVIMTADDPSAHSSQNEQDNRFYAPLSLMPMIEPSTPAEAKEMVAAAYEISEALSMPVLFRTTTRVNHARGIVGFGPRKDTPAKGHFDKDDARFVCVPANARKNRLALLDKNAKAAELSESSPLNYVTGKTDSDVGVITSGVGYTYVRECLDDVVILKLGFTYPLPERKIADFIKGKKKIIIVEELDPYLEDGVYVIMGRNGISVPVIGKRDGTLPRQWEFSPETMTRLKDHARVAEFPASLGQVDIALPARPPTLCAGCPHRGSFAAMKKAAGDRPIVYASDIGCYTLGAMPPFRMADFVLCMGGGAGVAGGFDASTDQKPVAFLGDSTFFHSGIPPLISAKFNNHKITMVILDNRITAMTGQQPNPGTGRDFGGIKTESVDIEGIVKGIGVDFCAVVNPFDVTEAAKVMKQALDVDGVSVIISRAPCQIDAKKRKVAQKPPMQVDRSKCIKCYSCVKTVACPALIKKADGFIETDLSQCAGCGMCASVCPKDAIKEVSQ